jgi:hypothetical protein
MSTSSLTSTFLNFSDGSSDTIRLTASSNILSFKGSTAGSTIRLSNVSEPTVPTDAATQNYVDSKISSELTNKVNGLSWKSPARVATTANEGGVYDSSALTFTSDSNGATVFDGVTLAVADRVLFKNQTTASQNGIYSVTSTGDGSNPYVLTRAGDANTHGEFENATVFVAEGATNADIGYTQTTDSFTMDASDANWAQFSSAGSYTGGHGVDVTGKVISADTDDTTVTTNGAGKVTLVAGGVDSSHLANGSVKNAAIGADAVDGTKIADNAINAEHITASSVTGAKLAADCIDSTKLADDAVNTEHVTDASITSSKLSSGSVATASLQDNSVTSGKIAAGAVGSTDIANDAITSVHVSAGAVGTAAMANASINNDKLADGSVNDAKFGTITNFTATSTITANTFTASSDATLKDDVETMDNCLDAVCKMNPVSYTFKDDESKCKRNGLIAQEVQEYAEHLVKYNDEKEHLTVNYIDIIAYLVGAVKELSAKLE